MPDPRDFLPPSPWEGPPLPEAFLRAFELTPERIELVQKLNNEVRKRTTYGTREEPLPGPVSGVWVLSWSNGSAEWYVSGHPFYYKHAPSSPEAGEMGYITRRPSRAGDIVVLDSNQFMVRAKKSDLLKVVRWLEPLPLYRFSFEAKGRGFFDLGGWLKALYESWQGGFFEEE